MADLDIQEIVFKVLDRPSALGERVHIAIRGEGPFARALPFRLRVGSQEARIGAVNLIDASLDAFLVEEPAEGDPVEVGFWGRELVVTTFVYHRPGDA